MRAIKIKTKNFVTLFFSLILTLAVFSQISAIKPQTTSDVVWGGGLNKADWLYYKSSNDLSAYLGKKSSSLPTVRYQKGGDYLEFSMTGSSYSKPVLDSYNLQPNTYNLVPVSSTTSVSLETNVKQPNTPTLFYRNILDGADVNYQITSIPFRVKEEIVLQSIKSIKLKVESQNTNLPPTTFLFSAETTAKPVKQDDGSVAFFDNQNNYLFQLDKPFMIDGKGTISNDVSVEIKPTSDVGLRRTNKTKNTSEEMFFGDSNLEWKRGLPPDTNQYIGAKNFVNTLNKYIADIKNVLDLGGIEPPKSLVATRDSLQARPRTGLFYHKENFNQNRHRMSVLGTQRYTITLTASSDWLNDPNTTYPVIIDPTVTHNADANFTGQFNRIADADSTTSTQLEASYPEATKDPYTVLLLHFNEANGTQTGIRDYASTTRVITANGNASTTNYVTQLGMGNSAAFDGTGDYLSMPDSSDFSLGNKDFSIDFWVYPKTSGSQEGLITKSGTDAEWVSIRRTSTNALELLVGNQGTWLFTTWEDSGNGGNIATNQWSHITAVRNGNVFKGYINGIEVGASTDTGTIGDNSYTVKIGRFRDGDLRYFNGHIDGVRILKGRALTPEEIKAAASRRPYAVYTSSVLDASASVQWDTLNWTEGGVGTGDGETLYNSSGLVAQWNFNETSGTTADNAEGTAALDGTLTNFAYTASQDQATTTTGWTANNKKWGGGSLMFDGGNDYVSVADNAVWDWDADFSVEMWVKFSNTSTYQVLLAHSDDTATAFFRLGWGSVANQWSVVLGTTSNQIDDVLTPGVWYHIAVTRTGSAVKLLRNGKQIGSNITDSTATNASTNGINIGANWNEANTFNGIIDSTRIYKGRALSAGEILSNYNAGNIELQTRTGATSDPNDGTWEAWKPTTGETQLLSMDSDKANWNAPEQIDGYTKLLLHMDGTDTATTFPNSATTTHTVTKYADAQVDTAQSKFGGGSALFDGTGDYLSVPDSEDFEFGANDFTIDFWARPNVLDGGHAITKSDTSGYGPFMVVGGASYWAFYSSSNGSSWDIAGGVSMGTSILNQWQHIAVVRTGNNIKFYINGQYQAQVSTSASLVNNTEALNIGRTNYGANGYYFTGHIDEFRISKGIARWTSNFTPPPRPYGSNVKAENETTLKQEGTGSTKLTLGAPQVDGNTVALWHFEETGTTTGTYLYDETANNNDATTTGTTVVDGIFGKARKFNGVDEHLHFQNSSSLQISTLSIAGWVKRDNLGVAGTIIGYGIGGWSFYIRADNTLALGKNGTSECFSTGTIPNTDWHLITVTYDTSTCRFYIDGSSAGSPAYANPTFSFTTNLAIGYPRGGDHNFKGSIDELFVSNRVLSADEIAETYRMGANHHLTRQVSATDLSAQTKLAFWIAADRPGTGLETMLGESDYANYELASSTLALSTNTVLYIKGDEIASSTSIKDSSFSGKAITANGNARTSGNGKIGNSVYFDGTGDYLSLADSEDWNFGSGDFSIDNWVNFNTTPSSGAYQTFSANWVTSSRGWEFLLYNNAGALKLNFLWTTDGTSGTQADKISNTITINTGTWYHVAVVRSGNTGTFYLNGTPQGTFDMTGVTIFNSTNTLGIGWVDNGGYTNGYLDEVRILKGTALTADQIRQAYEYGLRTHPITIDFGATLQPSDLISSASDHNFSLTATTTGLSATTSGLYLGDKIIIKENRSGTEYTAQGTVNSINTTTGAITVPLWDSGSSFPSGGFTQYATVFKWQREYFDLGGAATTTRNAITNLTLRPTNGAEGRTIYLDDFRYNTNYLTASSSSAITSGNNRYLQYRAIFSSWDSFVSPYLSAINTLYTSTANMFAPIIGISGGGFLSF